MLEIERKFLVRSEAYKKGATSEERIKQGFLNTHAERTVRVRTKGEFGYLTIKGKSNETGTKRLEREYEISLEDAEQLLEICEPGIIDKVRFTVPFGKHFFEVDEFQGESEGLVLAEVELQSEDEHFDKPDWLGKEVTGDIRYYNSQLSQQPFKTWNT